MLLAPRSLPDKWHSQSWLCSSSCLPIPAQDVTAFSKVAFTLRHGKILFGKP
jgi:hypothetical protein